MGELVGLVDGYTVGSVVGEVEGEGCGVIGIPVSRTLLIQQVPSDQMQSQITNRDYV